MMVGKADQDNETLREQKDSDWDMSNHAVDCYFTERKRLIEQVDNPTNREHNLTQFKPHEPPDLHRSGME
jgi:hypothetical protein